MHSPKMKQVALSVLVMAMALTTTAVFGQSSTRVHHQQAEKVVIDAGNDLVSPRITSITPQAGTRLVGNIGISTLEIRFDEFVIVPVGSVVVTGLATGLIGIDEQFFDKQTLTLTVDLDQIVRADILTVVVDYSVVDSAGNPLDGEIALPVAPSFPSGDNAAGGQAVIRYEILQGDVDRNGFVEEVDGEIIRDILGESIGSPTFDARADLNSDGFINVLDVAIWANGLGGVLPTTDGVPPSVVSYSPDPTMMLMDSLSVLSVQFSESIYEMGDLARSLYAVSSTGQLYAPSSASIGVNGDSIDFVFDPSLPQCDVYEVRVSNSLTDQSGSNLVLAPPVEFSGLIQPGNPTISPINEITAATSVLLDGAVTNAIMIEVVAPSGTQLIEVINGVYEADINLLSNRLNTVSVTAISSCGTRSSPRSVQIIQDNEAPDIFIGFPAAGAQIQADTTDVAGRVSDRLSGSQGLQVLVNGQVAEVDIGIGTNGTFFLQGVPLNSDGTIDIVVQATDMFGNTDNTQISVQRLVIPPNAPMMEILSGNGQFGQVQQLLAEPITVRMLRGDGSPFAGKVVTFKVLRSNGKLAGANDELGSMMYQTTTDSQGFAEAFWTVGSDAGCGNNRVSVTSRDIAGTIIYCASAAPAPADRILVGNMNNQRAEVGAELPEPLRIWVTDGCNGVADIPVTFTVTRGDGLFENNESQISAITDATGHLDMPFVLGMTPGQNQVEATFEGNPGLSATFFANGIERDLDTPTTFVGTVLDNANRPLGNARVELHVNNLLAGEVFTNVDGEFEFADIPDGLAHVLADGTTANTLAGESIPLNTFPFVGYDLAIVPNAINRLPQPALLPEKNVNNQFIYNGTQTVHLFVEGIEGLEFTVQEGTTVTLTDGTVIDGSDANSVVLSLDQVHFDKIPMPLPDGASYPFAWTLQPKAAIFDPPVAVTLPNMVGLEPGAIAYILQWDGEVNEFVITASGQVSDDGSIIRSDPGVGISVAGWGGACPPYPIPAMVEPTCSAGAQTSYSFGKNECCAVGPKQATAMQQNALRADAAIRDAKDLVDSNRVFIARMRSTFNIGILGAEIWSCGASTLREAAIWLLTGVFDGELCFGHLDGTLNANADRFPLYQDTIDQMLLRLAEAKIDLQSVSGCLQDISDSGCALPALEYKPGSMQEFDAGLIVDAFMIAAITQLEVSLGNQHTSAGVITRKINQLADDSSSLISLLEEIGAGRQNGVDEDDIEVVIEIIEQLIADSNEIIDGVEDLENQIETDFGNTNELLLDVEDVHGILAGRSGSVDIGGVIGELDVFGSFNLQIPQTPLLQRAVVEYSLWRQPKVYGVTPFFSSSSSNVLVGGIQFDFELPERPVSLISVVDQTVLIVQQSTSMTIQAAMSDGSTQILQGVPEGTAYSSSNSEIAEVSTGGTITGTSSGTAFVTASNQGVTSLVRIDVVETAVETLVLGFVQFDDGTPAEGVLVETIFGGLALTNAGGSFSIQLDQVPPDTAISVSAVLEENGQQYVGSSGAISIFAGGLSDAGVILLGLQNVGPIYPGQRFVSGRRPKSVSLGDLDIVVADGLFLDFDISVLLNLGDGFFASEQKYGTGNQPASVALGDLDGDGNLDIVVANMADDDISILRNVGDGTFAPHVRFDSGDSPSSISLGDLDGDGDLDVATANKLSNNASVLLNNGNGTFLAHQTYGVGDSPIGIIFGDLDNDGDLDMALANETSDDMSILLNNGNGTFGLQQLHDAGDKPSSVAMGDLDGDGDLEIVVSNAISDDVSVFYNNAGIIAPQQMINVGDGPSGIALVDVDGDGYVDIATANSNSHGISILQNLGGRTFEQERSVASGASPNDISFGDVDGDSKLDIIISAASTIEVILNTNGNVFQSQNRYGTGDTPYRIASGFFNADDYLDIAVVNSRDNDISVLINMGDGFFELEQRYSTGTDPQGIAVGDVDGDGDQDIVTANRLSGDTSVLLNNGDGTFANEQRYESGNRSLFLSLDDLDGDGDLDMSVANWGSTDMSLLFNNGDGTYATHQRVGLLGRPWSITVGDIDSDGDLDIAVSDGNVSVYKKLEMGYLYFQARILQVVVLRPPSSVILTVMAI